MNLTDLKDKIHKLPVTPLLVAYAGYLGYDLYTFMTSSGSALNEKKREVVSTQQELDMLHNKIKKMNDFAQTVSLKKTQLRSLAQELEATKSTLPETIVTPDVMNTLLVEAKRAGLTVKGMTPGDTKTGDFYGHQEFTFASTGIFFQYVAFMDRVASLQKVITVDGFKFTPDGPATAKYVQLTSSISLRAYRYVGSKADQLGKSDAPKPASTGKGT